jgi:carboxypeptidase C (cathepsin A)
MSRKLQTPLVLLLGAIFGLAATPSGRAAAPPPAAASGASAASATSAASAASTTETRTVTEHPWHIGRRATSYKATAGTLVIRDAQGHPEASVFYVAYTLAPAAGGQRPVTFLFNGGPGSASLWLHMGSFGPQRLLTALPDPAGPAPYRIVANAETLLDRSDLVFIDAVGTGYSRALPGTPEEHFFTVDQDLDEFARAIRRYLSLNEDWNAPKFLLGESYGATRAAGLVRVLQKMGIELNGVVLMSSILNTASYEPGLDQGYINFLPSFAAAAWHHRRAGTSVDLPAFIQQARGYAAGPYAHALAQGDGIDATEARSVAQRLSEFTGLDATEILQRNLRINTGYFRRMLLGNSAQVIGELDSRVSAAIVEARGMPRSIDPASQGISGAFVAAFESYVHHDLGYSTDLDYHAVVAGLDERWDWHHVAPGGRRLTTVDVALDLAAAMQADPRLRVYSLNGYYDLSTPFFATEYDLAHMLLPPILRRNIEFGYYSGGHMIYLDSAARTSLASDLDRFYDSATAISARQGT